MTNHSSKPETTDFGFKDVLIQEKSDHVKAVFLSVANQYDVMNDLMSFGLHRLWKRFTLGKCQVRPGQTILDIAGGTGDLARHFSKKVGFSGQVILADINEAMLSKGRDRLIDDNCFQNILFVQADAECLPFSSHYFDCLTIAFGLRNVTDKSAALRSMYRVLKPGGKCVVLEFSQPSSSLLNKMYDAYSFNIIPKLGGLIAHDEKSYQYLVESIRKHPNQVVLKQMMEEAGFEDVIYHNLAGGIVALHLGYKY